MSTNENKSSIQAIQNQEYQRKKGSLIGRTFKYATIGSAIVGAAVVGGTVIVGGKIIDGVKAGIHYVADMPRNPPSFKNILKTGMICTFAAGTAAAIRVPQWTYDTMRNVSGEVVESVDQRAYAVGNWMNNKRVEWAINEQIEAGKRADTAEAQVSKLEEQLLQKSKEVEQQKEENAQLNLEYRSAMKALENAKQPELQRHSSQERVSASRGLDYKVNAEDGENGKMKHSPVAALTQLVFGPRGDNNAVRHETRPANTGDSLESYLSRSAGDYDFVMYVDVDKNILSLLQSDGGRFVKVASYRCTTGRNRAPKSMEGDQATPIGLYRVTKGSGGLPAKYTKNNFGIEIPSYMGSGIKIVGTFDPGISNAIRRGQDVSNGGVVLQGMDFFDIDRRVGYASHVMAVLTSNDVTDLENHL
ncbi:hypothetical protein JW711_00050 [Candidatus Woesearchaeota archaeon]|nr:hypothetical protein [Candidatus Woesearchaeota archaeon]